MPTCGAGRLQQALVGTRHGTLKGLGFFQNRQPHTALLSLPAGPLTLSVSSKGGSLGPGVGFTGGAGGLGGRARTQKHW